MQHQVGPSPLRGAPHLPLRPPLMRYLPATSTAGLVEAKQGLLSAVAGTQRGSEARGMQRGAIEEAQARLAWPGAGGIACPSSAAALPSFQRVSPAACCPCGTAPTHTS